MKTIEFFLDWFRYKRAAWSIRNQYPLSPYLLKPMLRVADWEAKYGKGW